jgi:hypothetical protein
VCAASHAGLHIILLCINSNNLHLGCYTLRVRSKSRKTSYSLLLTYCNQNYSGSTIRLNENTFSIFRVTTCGQNDLPNLGRGIHWRSRQRVHPQRWQLSTKLHGVTSRKAEILRPILYLALKIRAPNSIAYSSAIIMCVLIFKAPTTRSSLVGSNAMTFGECPTFQRNILSTSSGLKSNQRNTPAVIATYSCWFLVILTLRPENGRNVFLRNVGLSSKCNPVYCQLHYTFFLHNSILFPTEFCHNDVLSQSWLSLF